MTAGRPHRPGALTRRASTAARWRRAAAAAILALLLPACSPFLPFYQPNRRLYVDPDKLGIPYEIVRYPSLNGRTLVGLYFRSATEPPIGTVVHFHGNFGNVSNHLLQSYFLTQHGFDVLQFDYEGYGGSEGHPSPRRTVQDGIASVRWADAHKRPGALGVVVFGQSLGAAIATVVAAKEPLVRAAALESGFTSYPAIAFKVMRGTAILWPLVPIYPWFLLTAPDPIDWIGRISPRPVLLLHGTADKIVPASMSKRLFKAAKDPKELWLVPNAGHLGLRTAAGDEYEKRLASFFTRALREPVQK